MARKDEILSTNLTEDKISLLVERFYDRVHNDERLGPIFISEVEGTWEEHTDKMKKFWRSVLLKSREYHGRPVPKHQRLQGITTADFVKWLRLFQTTAREILEPIDAQNAIQNAEKIASSLWLAMNPDPFKTPPDWASYKQLNVA